VAENPPTKLDELIEQVRLTQAPLQEISRKLTVSRIVQWVLGAVTAVMLIVVIVVVVLVVRLGTITDDIKASQISGCETGNNFRRDVIEFNDQRDIDYSRALAQMLGGSPEDLEQFLTILAESRTIPESFQPRDCEAIYG
jgi:hypothetical protein